MSCIPRKMNGHRVEQSSPVRRHLTGQKSLHYMCLTVAKHKTPPAVTRGLEFLRHVSDDMVPDFLSQASLYIFVKNLRGVFCMCLDKD